MPTKIKQERFKYFCRFILTHKIRAYSVLALTMVGSFACNSQAEGLQNNENIETITVSQSDSTLFIEDIYDSLEMVRLDNTVLLSGIGDVELFEDRFYVLDQNRLILALYDLNGNYISHVARSGRGPNEYISIFSMNIDPIARRVLFTDSYQGKIFVYDLLLNHERTINVDHHVGEVAGLRNGLFLHGQTNGEDRKSNKYKYLKNDILKIDSTGHVIDGFVLNRERVSTGVPLRSISRDSKGGFVAHPTLSDTIYYVSPFLDSVSRLFSIDFKLNGWTLANNDVYGENMNRNRGLNSVDIVRQLEQKQKTVAWGYIINTDSKLLIRFGNFNPIFCIYDKDSKKSVTYFGETIKGDNALRLLSAFPFSASKDRLYTGINIPTLKAMSEFEELSQEWIDKIDSLDMHGNPVIISYRIK